MENQKDLLFREPGVERLRLRFREALFALLALEPLNFVPTVETSFYHLDTAVLARHLVLAFFRRKGQNDSGRRNPAFGESRRLGPASS